MEKLLIKNIKNKKQSDEDYISDLTYHKNTLMKYKKKH